MRAACELIREHLPHAAIGADVIAGFPGETDDDHAATMSFIERLPFTYLHVFSFSKRPGTRAAAMPNEVPALTIRRRARELRALGERKAAAFHRTQVDRTLEVLTLRHTPPAARSLGHKSKLDACYLQQLSPGPFIGRMAGKPDDASARGLRGRRARRCQSGNHRNFCRSARYARVRSFRYARTWDCQPRPGFRGRARR